MGLFVNTNTTALTAYRLVGAASSKLGGSVEKLSSGLRINHAQDDPAGLAIAEKIRTQVNGLNRASMNAQDGTSLLQTAEGALGEVQSILQRVRTLSVQAANGTLTSNDRVEIQAEVDQLLDEVDRTASATEFNTKKLLDGSLSALVSVDDDDLTAIITGDKVVEGNYRLEKQMTPGQGEVLKSDIFRIVQGDQYKFGTRGLSDDINDATGGAVVGAGTDGRTLNASDFTLWQDIQWSTQHDDATVPGSPNLQQDFGVEYAAAGGGTDLVGVTDYDTAAAYTAFALTATTVDATTAATSAEAPYVVIEVVGLRTVAGTDIDPAASISGDQMTLDGTTYDGTANNGTQYVALRATRYSRTGEVIEQTEPIEVTSLDWTGVGTNTAGVELGAANAAAADLGLTVGATTDISMILGQDGNVVTIGDRIALVVDPGLQYAGGNGGTVGAAQSIDVNDTVNLDDANGYDSYLATNEAALVAGTRADFVRVGARVSAATTVTSMAGQSFNQSILWFDNDGQTHIGTGNIRFGDPQSVTAAGNFSFNLFESTLAERVTELQFIDRFQAGGESLFEPTAQTITMYSNGQSADIVLEAKDTLEEVAGKLRQAIVSSVASGGLGMGVDGDLSETGVDYNTAIFVSEATDNTDEAVAGTFVLRSTVPGTDGRFFFAGDESLINGFSWATVRDATLNSMKVDVFDAHSGEFVGSQTINDGVLRSVIGGVDVAINQRTDVSVSFDSTAKRLEYTSDFGKAVENVHVADNSLTLQIGANRGQTLDAIVGQVDRNSLELSNLLVVDRDVAEEALVKVDAAINKVSHQRALIGAYINRLSSTIAINDITAENLTAAESRIRDLDMAKEVINFTKNQVLTQAATAMLAQANTLPQTVLTLLR